MRRILLPSAHPVKVQNQRYQVRSGPFVCEGDLIGCQTMRRGPIHFIRAPMVLVIGLAVAAGCACAPQLNRAAVLPGGVPGVEIGTGTQFFLNVIDNQVLEVERGSQGGMHIYGSLRAQGVSRGSEAEGSALINRDRPWVSYFLESDAGELALENSMPVWLQQNDDGTFGEVGRLVQFRHYAELPEDWASIDWGEWEMEMETQSFRFGVRLLEADGTTWEDGRYVRLRFPPRPSDEDELSGTGRDS